MKTSFQFAPLACGALALLSAGCTQLSVQKVERGQVAKGIVYSLPKPLLKVNPLPNGTMQAEFVFIPDPENTYAIDTDSYLASHVFKVDVNSNGFLTQVTWNPDSAQVLKEAIDKAATTAISTAKLYEDARKAEETEKETKKTDCEKAEEAVKTLEVDVRTKQREKEKADENLARDERRLKEYTGTNPTDIARLEDAVLTSKQKADDAAFALNEAKVKLADGEAKRDKTCKGVVKKDKSGGVADANGTGPSDGLQNNPVNSRIASRPIVPREAPRMIFASTSLLPADSPAGGAKPPAVPAVPNAPGTSDSNPTKNTSKVEGKAGKHPDGNRGGVTNLPLVYGPVLFSIQEGLAVADARELRYGGHFDVRLVPVLAGTNPEQGGQDTFRTAKPYKPAATPEKITWTILGDPLTSLQNQADVVQARQKRDEVKRAYDAEQSEPKKTALKLEYEKVAGIYDDLVRIWGSKPLMFQLVTGKAVKGLELVENAISVKKKADNTVVTAVRSVKKKSDTEWEVRLSATIDPGDYYLSFKYKIGDDENAADPGFIVQ